MQEIKLNGYAAVPGYLHLGTQDSYGIETLHVVPVGVWEDMTITATFHTPNGDTIEMLVPVNGCVQVPPEATAAGTRRPDGKIVFVGVRDGARIISCDVRYDTKAHAETGGSQSTATPSLGEQVLSEVQAVREELAETETAVQKEFADNARTVRIIATGAQQQAHLAMGAAAQADVSQKQASASMQAAADYATAAEQSSVTAEGHAQAAADSAEQAATEAAKVADAVAAANEAAETVNGVVDTIPTGGTLLGTTLNFTRKKQQGLNTVTTTLFTVGVGGLLDKTLTKSNRAAEAAATAAAITEAKRGVVSESITGNPITATMGADRIESVAVQGLTTQAGTGDPSPENIREIGGVGVMDGKAEIVPATASAVSSAGVVGKYGYYCFFNLKGITNGAIVANRAIAENTTFDYSYSNKSTSTQVAVSNGGAKYTPRMYFPHEVLGTTSASTDADCKAAVVALLNQWNDEGNPLTIWYQKATHTEGDPYYTGVSVEDADGYHGTALPLAQPLYTGDTVETNVVSAYNKCVVLDGSETWTAGTITSGEARRYVWGYTDAQPVGSTSEVGIAASDRYKAVTGADLNTGNVAGLAVTTGGKIQFADPAITSLTDWKAYLAEQAAAGTPVTVWYKSTANGAPLRIAKETHAMKKLVLDGTETWTRYSNMDYQTSTNIFILADAELPNRKLAVNVSISNQFKNTGATYAFRETYDGQTGVFSDYASSARQYFRWGNVSDYADAAAAVAAFKEWLAAQYAAGTPVTIVYELATPEVYAHAPVEMENEAGSVVITAENTCEASLWANASKGDIAALLKRIEALENA